jgi:hypothetical protein
MSETPFHVVQVRTPDGDKEYVTLLSPSVAFSKGVGAEAKSTGDGYLYVIDQRTPTPQGAVPPDDIIGAFEVKGGEIVAGSYRSNANHKILSARGFFQLDAPLLACLIQELETRNRDA